MAETQYLALLRGINVGGSNVIRMADLRACFESMGLSGVTTYIQSGNVLFRAQARNRVTLTGEIERALSRSFDYESRVVLVTHQGLRKVVDGAPQGFGRSPQKYRYDVVFLKEPMTSREAMKSVTPREGVDTAHGGKGVLYFSRLIAKASRSHLIRLTSLPVYRLMTIRNWNTTTRLLAMMDRSRDGS